MAIILFYLFLIQDNSPKGANYASMIQTYLHPRPMNTLFPKAYFAICLFELTTWNTSKPLASHRLPSTVYHSDHRQCYARVYPPPPQDRHVQKDTNWIRCEFDVWDTLNNDETYLLDLRDIVSPFWSDHRSCIYIQSRHPFKNYRPHSPDIPSVRRHDYFIGVPCPCDIFAHI